MKLIAFIILNLLLAAVFVANAHAQQEIRKVEYLTIPYAAANAERTNPLHYSFTNKHVGNWILTIRNQLVYADNPDAKVVIRLKESPESERYVEIAMFGAPSKMLWAAVNNEQVGYMRMYEDKNSWFEDRPLVITFVENERVSAINGMRNVLDRLNFGPFALNTIEVYGRDASDAPVNAIKGELLLDVISGNPLDNPIMMVPPILAAAAGVTVVVLIKLKKRT